MRYPVIWQKCCFGQFHHSRMEVLQIAHFFNLVIFVSAFLMIERIERRFKSSKHKIRTLEDLKSNLEPSGEVTESDFAAAALNPGNEIKLITG